LVAAQFSDQPLLGALLLRPTTLLEPLPLPTLSLPPPLLTRLEPPLQQEVVVAACGQEQEQRPRLILLLLQLPQWVQ
jgi:hypothetical protein